jgi:hypothetical protein
VDVCWAWCCMCIKETVAVWLHMFWRGSQQTTNLPRPAQAHVSNPENIAQGKMQLMMTCWTGFSVDKN